MKIPYSSVIRGRMHNPSYKVTFSKCYQIKVNNADYTKSFRLDGTVLFSYGQAYILGSRLVYDNLTDALKLITVSVIMHL